MHKETFADGSGHSDLSAILQPQLETIDMKDGIYETGYMNRSRLFFALGILVFLSDGAVFAETHWETYLAKPTRQNAARVDSMSYSIPGLRDRQENHLGTLEGQVYLGDSTAVDLAFRLNPTADGVIAEDLDMILGDVIRMNPALFLKVLKRYRPLINRLDALVGNFGPEFVDDPAAQLKEADARIKSLKGVSDSDVKAVRDECVKELESQRQSDEEWLRDTSFHK